MTVPERLRAWIDDMDGEFVLAIEAQKFIASEREHYDVEFTDWLIETAAATAVTTMMRVHQSNQRSRSRAPGAFENRAKRFAAGDSEALSVFAITCTVSAENLRKPVALMTGADHLYVADEYRNTGRKAMLFDAFHRVIAKRVGAKTTAEVFKEADYARLQHWFLNGRRKDAEGELGAA